MRKVLITGVTGFAGSHLVDYLLTRNDCELHGIRRWRSRTENIEHLPPGAITLHECDLRDATSTIDTVKVAVLAALSIADELHTTQRDRGETDELLREQAERCLTLVERALKQTA